jgi:mannitol/fructose-specific phosphotransferase system IIA component (Ntr-type)
MTVEMDNTRFSSLFQPSEVICQTQETSRDEVLMSMLRLVSHKQGIGDIDAALRAVVERENDIPTIVGPGLAVVAVATSCKGIIYDPRKPDNPIKLMVLTLVPKATPGAYLQALSCLATICRDPSTA